MIEMHLREFERLLRTSLTPQHLKTVDHWNNQPAFYSKENIFVPAVFIDMGAIQWQPMVGVIFQQGKTIVSIHCDSVTYRNTTDKAFDADGGRLKRFAWIDKIMQTLHGKVGKDQAGNIIFNRLQLVGTTFDTNHDAFTDDVLMFSCQVFYYKAWRECNWTEIILQDVDTPYDSTITI